MAYLLLLLGVLTGILGLGHMAPMARRDGDLFGGVSAAIVIILSLCACVVTAWLVLTRRVMRPDVEAFLSFLLLCGFLWVLGFLLPKARRERDLFATVCSVLAALLALAGWLLFGTGVQSW